MLKLLRTLLAALALIGSSAFAQTVYRSIMPDGSVVYGDKPAPGAKDVTKISPPPLNLVPPPQNSANTNITSEHQHELDAANGEVAKARQQLAGAKAALDAGQEPEPGERIGTASGHSRLQDSYFQRVQQLEDAVTAAQQQLDDATAKRDAVASQPSND